MCDRSNRYKSLEVENDNEETERELLNNSSYLIKATLVKMNKKKEKKKSYDVNDISVKYANYEINKCAKKEIVLCIVASENMSFMSQHSTRLSVTK